MVFSSIFIKIGGYTFEISCFKNLVVTLGSTIYLHFWKENGNRQRPKMSTNIIEPMEWASFRLCWRQSSKSNKMVQNINNSSFLRYMLSNCSHKKILNLSKSYQKYRDGVQFNWNYLREERNFEFPRKQKYFLFHTPFTH